MPQYDNKQNTSCDPSKCKICRNKFSCAQYLDYLENIVQSQIDFPVVSNTTSIDITEFIKSNKETKDSLAEILVNKFTILENQNKLFQENITELTKKVSKLDKSTAIIDSSNSENGELVIYNGESDSETVLVEKKGIFGKTKWIEEKVKKENIEVEYI